MAYLFKNADPLSILSLSGLAIQSWLLGESTPKFDRINMLDHGRIIADGTTHDLLNNVVPVSVAKVPDKD